MHTSSECTTNPVHISESMLEITELLAPFDMDPAFKNRLQTAGVLIVPTDLHPEYEGPAFPDTTREVFRQLREELEGIAAVDALVRDEDFVEFQFNSEQIDLPILVVQHALAPLVINLLARFICDRLGIFRGQRSGGTVKSELHIKDSDGAQILLRYDGPADTFESVVSRCLPNLDSDSENEPSSSNND